MNEPTREEETADHEARYKAIAGRGVESTSKAPRTIPEGARVALP